MPLRPLDALDDLEEIELPAPLVLRRVCSTKACRATARPNGRHCPGCHRAAVWRYRDRHAQELTVRRRDADRLKAEDVRQRDSARAKLAMALKRGTMQRGTCQFCGTDAVIGLIEDPVCWRKVVWVCRAHRASELERRREVETKYAYQAKQDAWYDERDRVLAAIELLPPEERAQLHAAASRGPLGRLITPEAPLYTMNLVRLFKSIRDP